MVLDSGLLKCSYGLYSSLRETGEGKREFLVQIVLFGELYTSEMWMGMLEVVTLAMMGCMLVLGMEIGMQMDPESWSLQMGYRSAFCNTLFMKQESQLVTYAASPVTSTVYYIIVWQEDEAKVRNIKVIPNEECVRPKLVTEVK